jgi:hypothetical protein
MRKPLRMIATQSAGFKTRNRSGLARTRTGAGPFLSARSVPSVPFPLAPALPLGERKGLRRSAGESSGVGMIEGRPWLLPLPRGEGRGEGKRAAQ